MAQRAKGLWSAVYEDAARGVKGICGAFEEYKALNEQKLVPLPLRTNWFNEEKQVL